MVVSLKHAFQSSKTDTSDPSLVKPSNWNENHVLTMEGNRLLGRSSGGLGNVQEITLSGDFQFSGTELQLDDALLSDLNDKANVSTLVSEQPHLIPNRISGTCFVVVSSSAYDGGGLANGKLTWSEFRDTAKIANQLTRVIAGLGLSNEGGRDTLEEDITINMKTPETLNATTLNDPQFGGAGHTHNINCLSVASQGNGDINNATTVGSWALMEYTGSGEKAPGDTAAGSNLKFTSGAASSGSAAPGTWMCHGRITAGTGNNLRTVFRRISEALAAAHLVEYRNAKFNEFGSLDVEVHYVDPVTLLDEWRPATLTPNDDVQWYLDLRARVLAETTPAPYVLPTPAELRQRMRTITQRQLRMALINHNVFKADIQAAITAIVPVIEERRAEVEFEYADNFSRLNASVIQVLSILGFGTADEIDALWTEALALVA